MAKTKAKPATKAKQIITTHLAKVSLDALGEFWAKGFQVAPETLGNVTTHFDSHTRTAVIEYETVRPPDHPPVQKVTARRRKSKAN